MTVPAELGWNTQDTMGLLGRLGAPAKLRNAGNTGGIAGHEARMIWNTPMLVPGKLRATGTTRALV